jgi:hypothetical protein
MNLFFRKLFPIIFSVILLSPISAKADEDANEAEYRRLASEMERMGRQEIWSGVEKRFSEIEELEVTLSIEHYLLGAQSAQAMGNMLLVQDRLRKAIGQKRTRQIEEWLTDIERNYGNASLKASSKGEALLTPKEWPMDPIQRNSITVAQKYIDKQREFSGLLPKGNYTFIGHSFLVEPGLSIKLEFSPKQREKGLIKPEVIYPDVDGDL